VGDKTEMSLREGDSWPYLTMKQELTESDHEAVFSDGRRLPLFFRNRNGQNEFFVDIEYKWIRTSNVPGIVRYEKLLDDQPPVQEPAVEPAKPKNFAELQQRTQEQARNTMVERYGQNKSTNGDPGNLSPKWAAFAEAGKRARDTAFRSN